jgi:hypothetical protein
MVDRVVSADSHMLVLDEDVLANLASKHHEAYLGSRGAHRHPGVTRTSGSSPAPDARAASRPGEWDAQERLSDMDLDGVAAEVMVCDNAARLYGL